MTDIIVWNGIQAPIVADTVSDPGEIASHALQLRARERDQISRNLEAGHYEMASVFVWTRTMSLLKKQLGSLGNSFVGELLQRPDIDDSTDLSTAMSEIEAIALARDLGIITTLQTKRLLNSQSIVAHFASGDEEVGDEEAMTREEAVQCFRVCVQGVLGHERIQTAEDFRAFRSKLEVETLSAASPELARLGAGPYFFLKTAISILLSILKSAKGAQIEHASRNAILIIPHFWSTLKSPERWQVGQAYASEFNEGHKDSVRALHAVLVRVHGFDFVPENLRSATFVRVASQVIAAHQGMNNFYNEPAPMRELASLGSSIPNPALATCLTAALCVKLGNSYGVSNAAQASADEVLAGISAERWIYYLDGRLDQDLQILPKFFNELPSRKWIKLMESLDFDVASIKNPRVKEFVAASRKGNFAKVRALGAKLYERAVMGSGS